MLNLRPKATPSTGYRLIEAWNSTGACASGDLLPVSSTGCCAGYGTCCASRNFSLGCALTSSPMGCCTISRMSAYIAMACRNLLWPSIPDSVLTQVCPFGLLGALVDTISDLRAGLLSGTWHHVQVPAPSINVLHEGM